MAFHVGQKVVCVRDSVGRMKPAGVIMPVRDQIYVIRDIVRGFDGRHFRPGLLLEGLINPIGPYDLEYNFDPDRFRPLVEHKTDISVFTAMLNTSKQGQDA